MKPLTTSPNYHAIQLRGFSEGFSSSPFGADTCVRHTIIFADYAFLHDAHPDPAQRRPIPSEIQKQLIAWLDEGSIDPWACWWTALLKHGEGQRPLIGFSIKEHFSPDTPLLMEVAQRHFDWYHSHFRRYWMDEPWSATSGNDGIELEKLFTYTDASPDDCLLYQGKLPKQSADLLDQRKTWAINTTSYLHDHYPNFQSPQAQKAILENRGSITHRDVFTLSIQIVLAYGGEIPAAHRNHPTWSPLVLRAQSHMQQVLAGLEARASGQPIPPGATDPATLSQEQLFPLANIGQLARAFAPHLWQGREAEALALINTLPNCMVQKVAVEACQLAALSTPACCIVDAQHEGQRITNNQYIASGKI